jgi:hypothetical protein
MKKLIVFIAGAMMVILPACSGPARPLELQDGVTTIIVDNATSVRLMIAASDNAEAGGGGPWEQFVDSIRIKLNSLLEGRTR